MIKFLKFILFIIILIILSVFIAFQYINSQSFSRFVQNRLSQELGNSIKFDSLHLHRNGDVTLKGLEVLDLENSPLLSVSRIELELNWSDLLAQVYLPQEVKLFNVDLDFRVKESVWPLAILNQQKKLPPSPDFYAKIKNCNLHLGMLNAYLKKYSVNLDLYSAEIEQIPIITNFKAKGVVSEHSIKFESADFGLFSGEVMSMISVLFDQNHKVKKAEVDLKLVDIDLAEVGNFAKSDPFQVSGNLGGTVQIGFEKKEVDLKADLTTGSLVLTEPGIKQVLKLLKYGNSSLMFTSSHLKLEASEREVNFQKLELLNQDFISLYAPSTKITLAPKYQPVHIKLPLRLSAPYQVIKWSDYAMKYRPSYIEIPFDLDCDVKDMKTELINTLIYTIQKHSLKKSLKKLESKLGFEVNDQVIDVKKVLDHKAYKEIKTKVKKQVERIDRDQVDHVIDIFEKDDKKKKKLKQHIDLFMQFLQ